MKRWMGVLVLVAAGCAGELTGGGETPWEETLVAAGEGKANAEPEELQRASAALTSSAQGTVSWTGGDGLVVRDGPGTGHPVVDWLAEGTRVTIGCQASGTSVGGNVVWDYLPDYGGYVSDYFMNTGYSSWISGLPRCGDASASGTVSWTDGDGLTVRAGPGTGYASVGWLAEGTTAEITCQAAGTSVGGNVVWDYLPDYGGYVSDAYMWTGHASWIDGLPRCEGGSSEPITINGYTLSATQQRWFEYVAEDVLPRMQGSRSSRLTKAARVVWWSLKEGILGLDSALAFSSCYYPYEDANVRMDPVEVCPYSVWQVGLAAVQVNNYSSATVEGVAGDLYPGSTIRQVLANAADDAGFTSGYTHDAIVNATGSLRRSWLLRDAAIGFELQHQTVYDECLDGSAMSWCFSTGWTASRKFAPNESTGVAVYHEVRSALDRLSAP